jgi:transposase
MVVRHRDQLVRLRTQAKNRIHAILVCYNLVSPASDLFGIKGRQFLAEVLEVELRSAARSVVQDHLELIEHLSQQIEALESNVVHSSEQ